LAFGVVNDRSITTVDTMMAVSATIIVKVISSHALDTLNIKVNFIETQLSAI
jgi:hypothetical protein